MIARVQKHGAQFGSIGGLQERLVSEAAVRKAQ